MTVFSARFVAACVSIRVKEERSRGFSILLRLRPSESQGKETVQRLRERRRSFSEVDDSIGRKPALETWCRTFADRLSDRRIAIPDRKKESSHEILSHQGHPKRWHCRSRRHRKDATGVVVAVCRGHDAAVG